MHHNDTTSKTDAWRKTHEGRHRKISLTTFYLSFYCKSSKGLFKVLHVRGCWRPNINFIFWPHCYDRHVVSFLFSWCWGPLHRGFSEGPLGRVWLSLPHLVSRCLEFCWQLHRGFSECPLGRVWPSLPHQVSTVWKSAGNCFGTPNSTELNNNSTPTRSPIGSLNRMFNRHQAEITVMQFRGYSLPVHDCNGTMGPSPCPIS